MHLICNLRELVVISSYMYDVPIIPAIPPTAGCKPRSLTELWGAHCPAPAIIVLIETNAILGVNAGSLQ